MPRQPHVLLFLSLLALVAVLMALPGVARARLKNAWGGLYAPLFGLTAAGQDAADRLTLASASRAKLADRAIRLELENQRLRLEALQGREALRENERLRAMLGDARNPAWRLKPARVIGRDPANWWRTVFINLGAADGLTANLPVFTAEGLAGRVVGVGARTAQVVLVGDPNCPVAAAIAGGNEQGIIRSVSGGGLDGDLVDLTYVPRQSALVPGQQVFTSGAGGLYPPGIPIGEVVDFRSVGYGLYLEARVRLAVKAAALRSRLG